MDAMKLKDEVHDIIENNILPFWINKMTDEDNGGFYGRIDGNGVLHKDAEKGAVLNARILWTFSAAYRVLHRAEYLKMAKRARDYVSNHFIDKDYGGVYWSLSADGFPSDAKKQTYAIGFAIYGLSEYVRITGDEETLKEAVSLYEDLEKHTFDQENNGYVEALTREWRPIEDMRLSDKDENGSRTMNTHLHILEAYTNLYRTLLHYKGKNQETISRLGSSIENILTLFTEKIINPNTQHLDLFFDDKWAGKRNIHSYGHDVEAGWLMHEAALVLGEPEMIRTIEPYVIGLTRAADEGLQPDGSLIYERWIDTGKEDRQRQWWTLCEYIVGHVNIYQYFHDVRSWEKACRCWQYVKEHLVDWEHGEWFWGITGEGERNRAEDKAGFWKCPYHNSRMCLEIIERNNQL